MVHAIVVGGSSGIGLEIARRFIGRDYTVSLIARRSNLLDKARAELTGGCPKKQGFVHTVSADVTDRARLSLAVAEAEMIMGSCDILVVTAGRVDPAFFDRQPPDVFDAQINLNLVGSVNAVRTVYVGMKTRRRGKIVLISSGAAAIGIPGYSAYCASKSALKGFAEVLNAEACVFGVHVLIAYPPDTRTTQYAEEIIHRPAQADKLMGRLPPWSASKVAEKIEKAIDRNATEVHFGFALTMLALFGAFIKPVLYWLNLRSSTKRKATMDD